MTIEIISEQNIEQLTSLTLELWSECTYSEELKNWQSVMVSPHEVCFLAKDGQNYIGFVHLSIRTDYVEGAEKSPVGYVEGLYVKEKYRKMGIAKQILNEGEIWAKSKGLTQIASDTEIDNFPSIEFHHKIGFKEANRIVCLIKDL